MKHLEPRATWVYLLQHPNALFVDLRMEIEHLYVGHPPGVVHIPWYEYPEMHVDPARFVAQVECEAGGTTRPVVLLCRSGRARHWRPPISARSSTSCTPSRVSSTRTSSVAV